MKTIPPEKQPWFHILLLVLSLAMRPAPAQSQDSDPPGPATSVLKLTPTAEATDAADESAVKTLDAANPEAALSGNGFTYRHNWGLRNGQWKLNLNWGAIRAGSRVFVSISECGHTGAARYTVHNVVPANGGVSIWVNIEWGNPIPLCVDYLVVNPPGAAEGGLAGADVRVVGNTDGTPSPSSDVKATPTGELDGNVDSNAVSVLANAKSGALLSGDGFTYRHNWGNRSGPWKLNLNWGAIRSGSRVFVSISECGHMGAARYTVHNVVPANGGVSIWVNIEWGSPIPLCVDYLVVNPPGAATEGESAADSHVHVSAEPASDTPSPSSDVRATPTQEAVVDVPGASGLQPELAENGFTYHHNWGNRMGQWKLTLNWAAIRADSRVFASISECGHMGAARYTVHNVVPFNGGVTVWLNIEWGSPIPLCINYLIANPQTVTPPPEAPIRTVRVTVHRHSTVTLSNADADRILADMGTVLQTADQSNDVATRVQFVRNGDVQVLPAAVPASIQTAAQFTTLMGAGNGVKVVRQILWCGSPGGSIIGCAPVGNANVNLAVVRFTANQEGILWAHEYGHNAGLPHRTDDGNAIMFPSIATNRRVVNAAESTRYLSGPLALRNPTLLAAGAHPHGNVAELPKAPADVRDFVRQSWVHGIPFALAKTYGQRDAEVLLQMLEAPAENDAFLPNIVTTLCFIGNDKVVDPLIAFVKNAALSSDRAYQAKNAVLIHLGDLIHRTQSKTALDFLRSVVTSPDTARRLAASKAEADTRRSATAQPAEDLGSELAISATWGLALAGTQESRDIINSLGNRRRTLEGVSDIVTEALETHRKVRELGQVRYYESICQDCP